MSTDQTSLLNCKHVPSYWPSIYACCLVETSNLTKSQIKLVYPSPFTTTIFQNKIKQKLCPNLLSCISPKSKLSWLDSFLPHTLSFQSTKPCHCCLDPATARIFATTVLVQATTTLPQAFEMAPNCYLLLLSYPAMVPSPRDHNPS